MSIVFRIIAVAAAVILSAGRVEADPFAPMVHNYLPKDYHAANQNWSVTQAPDGMIYVANTGGLLCFDGAHWSLVRLPDRRIVRAVKATADGRIYIGSFEEFGFFQRSQHGELEYTSLVPLLNDYAMENDEIWTIVEHDGAIYFHSFSSLFRYDGKEVCTKRFDENILMIADVGGTLYVNLQYNGLRTLDPRTMECSVFLPSPLLDVVSVLPFGDGRDLAVTQRAGLYIIGNGQTERFRSEADGFLISAAVNRAISTSEGFYVFGTISGGIRVIDRNGKMLSELSVDYGGLANNTVLGLFNDRNDNIWAALDKGVSVFMPSSSLRKMSRIQLNVGTIYSVIEDKGMLYMATNQGLYAATLTGDDIHARMLLSGQAWDLYRADGSIFCNNNSVTCRLKNGRLYREESRPGGVCMAYGRIGGREVLVQASYSTLCLYTKNHYGEWRYSHEIEGFINPIRYIEIDYKGRIWGSHFQRGMYKIELNDDLRTIARSDFVASPDEGNSLFNVFQINGQVVFANKSRLYTFDEATQTIVPFEKLNAVLGEFKTAYRVAPFGRDRYWFITPTHAALVEVSNSQMRMLDVVPYAAFAEDYIDDQQNIVPVSADSCLFLFENSLGLYTYQDASESAVSFPLRIDRVTAYDIENERISFDVKTEAKVPYTHRKLTIDFFQPDFDQKNKLQYRYRLADGDALWSTPSESNSITFSYLPVGDYALEVESVDERGRSLQKIVYRFRIEPPFYFSTLALILYGLLFAGLVAFAIWRIKAVIARNRLKIMEREAQLRKQKHDEQQQEIYRLRNEQLEHEINFKSKELASSTMSIIRKNNILVDIKNELSVQKERLGVHYPAKYYDRIVRMIDQNITSDDDWSIFQTNFDRIHENFFRNLKERYPELSSGDLRLCAYLRLNLTTKEIANLMNISVKGVETARYRLRKKLDILSDENLTEFMIQFK